LKPRRDYMDSVKIISENCKGCGYCVVVCPKKVLEMGESANRMGYRYAVAARPDQCIACKLCAVMCPDSAIEIFK